MDAGADAHADVDPCPADDVSYVDTYRDAGSADEHTDGDADVNKDSDNHADGNPVSDGDDHTDADVSYARDVSYVDTFGYACGTYGYAYGSGESSVGDGKRVGNEYCGAEIRAGRVCVFLRLRGRPVQ